MPQFITARESHIQQWRRSATRERSLGNTALALTYENMAWLLEHTDMWTPPIIESAFEQAQAYVEALNKANRSDV
jgi:hypothetical protein